MDDIKYPGFTPEQIEYLEKIFPSVDPQPNDTLSDIMFASGSRQVIKHIKAQETNKT